MLTYLAPTLLLSPYALVVILAIRKATSKPTPDCINRANAYLQATETEREAMRRQRRAEMGLKRSR